MNDTRKHEIFYNNKYFFVIFVSLKQETSDLVT